MTIFTLFITRAWLCQQMWASKSCKTALRLLTLFCLLCIFWEWALVIDVCDNNWVFQQAACSQGGVWSFSILVLSTGVAALQDPSQSAHVSTYPDPSPNSCCLMLFELKFKYQNPVLCFLRTEAEQHLVRGGAATINPLCSKAEISKGKTCQTDWPQCPYPYPRLGLLEWWGLCRKIVQGGSPPQRWQSNCG